MTALALSTFSLNAWASAAMLAVRASAGTSTCCSFASLGYGESHRTSTR